MYSVRKFATMATIILSLLLTGMQPLTARPMIRYASLFQGGAVINGDFENSTNNWTRTSGYFNVQFDSDPSNPSNHVGLLRGATGYISRIEQTVTGLTPGKYALYIEKTKLTSSPPPGALYTTNATVIVPGVSPSPSNTVGNNTAGQGFTVDFCVPAGQSTATIKISVTGNNSSGRFVELDNISVIWISNC
jgi:hypothetical protein